MNGEGQAWYDRLLNIDRRWIYLLMALVVIVPAVRPFTVPVGISGEVRAVHEYIEAQPAGGVIHLAVDYDPSTLAELQPMAEAILHQCFAKDLRLVITALSQFGPAMVDELVTRIAAEHGKVRGVDYAFLGYKPYPAITILAMGSNYRVPFPTDFYGTTVDSIPMMRDIHNFSDVACVVSLAGGNVADMWIQYGNAKYGVPVALGVTGVMASDYYPYLQSGQIFGLVPGVKGAAEYERLRGRLGEASRGMPYQVTSHLLIILAMLVANIGFVAQRRARAGVR